MKELKTTTIKKPVGNIKYEIKSKRSMPVCGCGPIGYVYEIEFLILSDNSHLFVCSDDMSGAFSVADYSVIDLLKEADNGKEVEFKKYIEEIEDFSEAEESKYYDLYLEVEKFRHDC